MPLSATRLPPTLATKSWIWVVVATTLTGLVGGVGLAARAADEAAGLAAGEADGRVAAAVGLAALAAGAGAVLGVLVAGAGGAVVAGAVWVAAVPPQAARTAVAVAPSR